MTEVQFAVVSIQIFLQVDSLSWIDSEDNSRKKQNKKQKKNNERTEIKILSLNILVYHSH